MRVVLHCWGGENARSERQAQETKKEGKTENLEKTDPVVLPPASPLDLSRKKQNTSTPSQHKRPPQVKPAGRRQRGRPPSIAPPRARGGAVARGIAHRTRQRGHRPSMALLHSLDEAEGEVARGGGGGGVPGGGGGARVPREQESVPCRRCRWCRRGRPVPPWPPVRPHGGGRGQAQGKPPPRRIHGGQQAGAGGQGVDQDPAQLGRGDRRAIRGQQCRRPPVSRGGRGGRASTPPSPREEGGGVATRGGGAAGCGGGARGGDERFAAAVASRPKESEDQGIAGRRALRQPAGGRQGGRARGVQGRVGLGVVQEDGVAGLETRGKGRGGWVEKKNDRSFFFVSTPTFLHQNSPKLALQHEPHTVCVRHGARGAASRAGGDRNDHCFSARGGERGLPATSRRQAGRGQAGGRDVGGRVVEAGGARQDAGGGLGRVVWGWVGR